VCDDVAVTAELIDLARADDGEAFRQLVGPYQRELQVHCYRMLGSVQDAEDAMQDALLAAWQGLGGFQERASVLPDAEPGPEARYETHEAISLAFITAVQLLPPRQRAVLILRDVLGFAAGDAAQVLGSTEESVTSALKRARAAMRNRVPHGAEPPPVPGSASEKDLIDRLTHAYETGDVDGLIALFTDDAWLAMPPAPLEYQGRDLIARFLAAISFRDGRTYGLSPREPTASSPLAPPARSAT
jgi:DNA-directed RNA polymerase specialized sigma24 family protein